MSDEFESNSLKSKHDAVTEKKREIKAVTTSTVKSKSKMQRVMDNFVHRNTESIKDYVIETVLIPAITSGISGIGDIIIDSLIEGVGNLFESGGFDIHRDHKSSTTSYSEYYRKRHRHGKDDRDEEYEGNKRLSYDEIVVPTRSKAEAVIAELKLIIREDGRATVAQLFETVEQLPTWTDNNWGWRSLDSADWVKVRDGYLLKFPQPKKLD